MVMYRAGPGQAAAVINALCAAYAEGDKAALDVVERYLPRVASARSRGIAARMQAAHPEERVFG